MKDLEKESTRDIEERCVCARQRKQRRPGQELDEVL